MWITVLRVLLALVTIQSSTFFLTQLKVSTTEWLVFNACAPSNIILLVGELLGWNLLRYMAIYPMFFFGVQGLFVFPWNGIFDLIPQFSHLIMTFNIVTLVWEIYTLKMYETACTAFLMGIVFITPLIYQQQQYGFRNRERMQKILCEPMHMMQQKSKK